MSKDKGTLSWKSASGVGGISTMFIAVIQSGVIELSKNEISLYSTITPIISAAIVTLIIWIFAHLGVKTTSQIVVENIVETQISYWEEKITKNKKEGNDTSELQKELNKAYKSKSILFTKTIDDTLASR